MKINKIVVGCILSFFFFSVAFAQVISFETPKLKYFYTVLISKKFNTRYLKKISKELQIMKNKEFKCIEFEDNMIKSLSNYNYFIAKSNPVKYKAEQPVFERKLNFYEQQKQSCQLRLYEINFLMVDLQKELNRLHDRTVITVNKSILEILKQPINLLKDIRFEPVTKMLGYVDYSRHDYSLIIFLALVGLLAGFVCRYFLFFLMTQKHVSKNTLKVLTLTKKSILFFIPFLFIYVFIFNKALYYYTLGPFEKIFKFIYEIFILKYIFDIYLILGVKDEQWHNKLNRVFNLLWIFFGFNSVVEVFFNRLLVVNNTSLFLLKLSVLFLNIVLLTLLFKLIKLATDPQYHPKKSLKWLKSIRHGLNFLSVLLIFSGIFISWAYGLDYVDLEIFKKLILLFAVGLVFKFTVDMLDKLEEGIQTNRFFRYENFKHYFGTTNKNEKIKEITGIRIIIVLYLALFVFLPMALYFFEISNLLGLKYTEFVFNGFMLGPINIVPFNLLNAIFLYLVLILLSKFLIEKVIQNPVFVNNQDRKVIMLMTLKYLSQILSFIIALSFYGFNFGNISIILGGLSVGVGIGMNVFLGDMISGLLILFGKYLRINDYVTISEKQGLVKGHIQKINLLFTQILTDDYNVIYISNSKIINNPLVNHTVYSTNPSCNLMLSLKNSEDATKAKELCLKILMENNNIAHGKNLTPQIHFEMFMDDNQTVKNVIFLTFNLHDFSNKQTEINMIRQQLETDLTQHRIQLNKGKAKK
jgi:hypothetical protein